MAGMNKVQSGDSLKIPAATYNTFIDAAKDFQRRQQGNFRGNPHGTRQQATILVENASGSDIDEGKPLGIDSPVYGPDDNADEFVQRLAIKGVTPTDDHIGKFVITAGPIAAGKIGRAYASGVCCAQVTINDADDTAVDIVSGDLESSSTGSAQILWAETGTGEKWAVLRFGGVAGQSQFPAKITGSADLGPNRWAYSITEMSLNVDGTFSTLTSGRTGTAYNTLEANNIATGIQGSGDDVSEFPAGITLQPIGIGAVVFINTITNCESADEYLFAVANNAGGDCV